MQYFKKRMLALLYLLFICIQVNGQKKQKCFEDNGLKYKTIIHINFLSSTQVTGTVASNEYDAETPQKADFTGTITGKILKIKFKNTPPIIGDATEWTNKPWIFKKNKGVEMLYIIFHSKNYDTKKWSDITYKLMPCQ